MWYIDKLNAEAGGDMFGYCFDLGHANLVGANIREFVRALGDRLTVLHLHDNDAVTDQHLAPMTQKKTDWEGLILGLRDINYRGAINFETFNALTVLVIGILIQCSKSCCRTSLGIPVDSLPKMKYIFSFDLLL